MKKIALALLALLSLCSTSYAQSGCPSIVTGAVLTAAQWNQCFILKQNSLGFTPVSTAGGVMTGRLVTTASTTSAAGFNVPQGTAPTSPVNGDVWTTSGGMFVRINGATLALTGIGGVTVSGSPAVGNTIVATSTTTAVWQSFIPITYDTRTALSTIVSADCGKGILLSTNYFTTTVPDPAGLTAKCELSLTNTDATPGRGKRLAIFGKTAYNLMAGQSVTLRSTGTAWIESIPGPQRWRPIGIGNIAFYVSTTGSQSGDGLGGCAGAPFDDNPYAYDYIAQNLDPRSMDPVYIVSCAGTYTSNVQGVHAASNIGFRNGDLGITFTGPLTAYDGNGTCIDPAAVIRNNGAGAVVPLFQPELAYSTIAVGCMTLTSTAAQPLLNPDRGSALVVNAGIRLGNVPNGTAQIAISRGVIRLNDVLTVTGDAGASGYFMTINDAGIFRSAGNGITFNNGAGTPNVYNTVVFLSGNSVAVFGAFTAPNGVTGQRFGLINSVIGSPTGVYSPTFIPGSTAGTMVGNASIDNFQNPNFPNNFVGTLGSGSVSLAPAVTVYAPLPATGAAIAIRQANNVAFGSDITVDQTGGDTIWSGVNNNVLTPGITMTRAGLVTLNQGLTLTGALAITSNSANALAVGRLGTTTPALQIDASTATSITGIKIKSAATTGGVAISAIGETNVALSIDAAGNGQINIGATSTGSVLIGQGVSTPVVQLQAAQTRIMAPSGTVGLSFVNDNLSGFGSRAIFELNAYANSTETMRWTAATNTSFASFRANSTLLANAAQTLASAATVAWNDFLSANNTTTLTGSTTVTSIMAKAAFFGGTLTDASAVTVNSAASVYIDAAPAAAGSLTIGSSYALYINSGLTFTGGGISQATSNSFGTVIAHTPTIASAASISWGSFQVSSTLTLTGSTTVSSVAAMAALVQPIITDASAVTVTDSATLFIQGAPVAGGSVTLTNAYAIYVGAGASRLQEIIGGVVAVGSLPTCNAGRKASRLFVNDSNAVSFTAGIGAVVAAGGGTNVPVVCDGTNWRIGGLPANDNLNRKVA